MSPATFATVVRRVYDLAGIVLDESKRYLVETRLHPIALRLGFPSLDALVAAMGPGSEVETTVVEALTTNETSFFRDLAVFQALEREVVPELMARRASSKRLRIWSAACSTGQEAYSILMTLLTRFPELESWDLRVVGTDVNETVLRQAAEGKFSQLEVNRGLPAPMLIRWFEREGRDWRISPELRRRLEVRPLNLVGPWPVQGRFDLVFLRNVLIYFDAAARVTILERAQRVVAPDGLLFLGGAETPRGTESLWDRRAIGRSFAYAPRHAA